MEANNVLMLDCNVSPVLNAALKNKKPEKQDWGICSL